LGLLLNPAPLLLVMGRACMQDSSMMDTVHGMPNYVQSHSTAHLPYNASCNMLLLQMQLQGFTAEQQL
jgi:hypothetical protein